MPSSLPLRPRPHVLAVALLAGLVATTAAAQDVTASETLSMELDDINMITITGSVPTMTWDNDTFEVGSTSAVKTDTSTQMDYTLGQGVAMKVHFDETTANPTQRVSEGSAEFKYSAIREIKVQVGDGPPTKIFESNGSTVEPTVAVTGSPATVVPANPDGGQGSGETPATVTYTVEVDLTMGGAFDGTTFDLVYTAVDPTP